MTPPARIAAAIDILDLILSGTAAEKVLTGWGRRNRYAGSGDRAAIRDHVFSALRCKQSYAYLGRALSGRGLMVGWAHANGVDIDTIFTGAKYAPDVLSDGEKQAPELTDAKRGIHLDCPDWLLPKFEKTAGKDTDAILKSLQRRAPLFLRVNTKKTDLASLREILEKDGINTSLHPLSGTALEVTKNPRKVAQSAAYKDGLVEVQDVASQAVVDFLPLFDGQNVLDYCAGGGGKTLAMAARADVLLTAHDSDADRMGDLPARAERAGIAVGLVPGDELKDKSFDLVLCDVPCSGSGSWRRSPDSKWLLTSDRLTELVNLQADILLNASKLVTKNGVLAYVTCSLFEEENGLQIKDFIARNSGWLAEKTRQFSPLEGGDGFFVALLRREAVE